MRNQLWGYFNPNHLFLGRLRKVNSVHLKGIMTAKSKGKKKASASTSKSKG